MAPSPRVRFRKTQHFTEGHYNWGPYDGPIPSQETTTSYEYMADTVGRASVRPCNQVTWKLANPSVRYHDFVTQGTPCYVTGIDVPVSEHVMDNILDLPDESELQNPMLRAFNSFSTVFPSKFAPIEFVEGLKDWRKLIPSLSGNAPRDLASFYLGQKWGRDQLISDINYLSGLLRQCQSRLDWLRKTYGKPTPLFYKERLEPPSVEPFRVTFWVGGSWGTKYVLENCDLVFSARATLLHRIPHLNDYVGLYQAIVSALGANNPLKAIWQSLRLSFLFDWIFDVSALLDRLAQIRPAAQWELYDVTHSVRLNARFRIEQDNTWSGVTSDNVPLTTLQLTRYRRSLGLPLVLTDLIRTSFSPNQLLALAALLTSTSSR